MSETSDRLRRELAKATRIHGGLTTDAVADALAASIPAPTWAATLRPGDTLVLGFDGNITHEQFEAIRDQLRKAMPAEVGFVVVSGATSMAVQRDDGR